MCLQFDPGVHFHLSLPADKKEKRWSLCLKKRLCLQNHTAPMTRWAGKNKDATLSGVFLTHQAAVLIAPYKFPHTLV
jgi:hypothetical protein